MGPAVAIALAAHCRTVVAKVAAAIAGRRVGSAWPTTGRRGIIPCYRHDLSVGHAAIGNVDELFRIGIVDHLRSGRATPRSLCISILAHRVPVRSERREPKHGFLFPPARRRKQLFERAAEKARPGIGLLLLLLPGLRDTRHPMPWARHALPGARSLEDLEDFSIFARSLLPRATRQLAVPTVHFHFGVLGKVLEFLQKPGHLRPVAPVRRLRVLEIERERPVDVGGRGLELGLPCGLPRRFGGRLLPNPAACRVSSWVRDGRAEPTLRLPETTLKGVGFRAIDIADRPVGGDVVGSLLGQLANGFAIAAKACRFHRAQHALDLVEIFLPGCFPLTAIFRLATRCDSGAGGDDRSEPSGGLRVDRGEFSGRARRFRDPPCLAREPVERLRMPGHRLPVADFRGLGVLVVGSPCLVGQALELLERSGLRRNFGGQHSTEQTQRERCSECAQTVHGFLPPRSPTASAP
ncbi:MAG TPA: hypothetical protein VFO51_05495 [Sphingomicrobium sp.]|nr:hypothetical protein [Sphingomicrobium sp.]